MSLIPYDLVTVYLREGARWQGRPLHEEIIRRIRDLKLCVRCSLYRSTEGCFESGDVASSRILVLSADLPMKLEIVHPQAETEPILALLDEMVQDGVVAVSPLNVAFHRTPRHILPAHIMVRDVMTENPVTVSPETDLGDAARLLLEGPRLGIPVIAEDRTVLGMCTQTDVLEKTPGIFSALGSPGEGTWSNVVAGKKVRDVMTAPAVTVGADTYLPGAVSTLVARNLKRLPVTDDNGKLVGLVTRLDLLGAISRHTPQWYGSPAHRVTLTGARTVGDVADRSPGIASPETLLGELVEKMLTSATELVPVVDAGGVVVSVVGESDLFDLFPEHSRGLWELLAKRVGLTGLGDRHPTLREALATRTARDIAPKEVPLIGESASLEEAASIMAECRVRNLVVIDPDGKYVGLVDRTDILRGGLEPHGLRQR